MTTKCLIAALVFVTNILSAQGIDINTSENSGNRYITTKNYRGTSISVSDNVVTSGAVFFSAGYQYRVLDSGNVESYFINIDMVHNDNRIGCLKEYTSKLFLILEDDSKIECFQVSESDCGPNSYTATFVLMDRGGNATLMRKNFDELLNKKINKIQVYTSEKVLDYNVKQSFKPYLKKHFEVLEKAIKEKK